MGSINWLRGQMQARGANPNVVRNIIYRDRGSLHDKRALYAILRDLGAAQGLGTVGDPALEHALTSGVAAEHDALRLLRRESRQAVRDFIGRVGAGDDPKLLVTGRPGSGKTLLADVVHEALASRFDAGRHVVRVEFRGGDLATALMQLGRALGADASALDRHLSSLDPRDAFAVQADAQATVARALVASVPARGLVLIVHVSHSAPLDDTLAGTQLRLDTADVPRVGAADWLWLSLLEPLARRPGVAAMVSMSEVPARSMQRLGPLGPALRLTPPTRRDARRFVAARVPEWSEADRTALIDRAGRSYEDLRTLILLHEVRGATDATLEEAATPTPRAAASGGRETSPNDALPSSPPPSVERLARAVVSTGDDRLRDFLEALAVLSTAELPDVRMDLLDALRRRRDPLTPTERAFLDPVPSRAGAERVRCFSRHLGRALHDRLRARDPERYRALHRQAACFLRAEAERDVDRARGSEARTAYLEHLLRGRDWPRIVAWLESRSAPHAWLQRVGRAAESDHASRRITGDDLDRLTHSLVRHRVTAGAWSDRNTAVSPDPS